MKQGYNTKTALENSTMLKNIHSYICPFSIFYFI